MFDIFRQDSTPFIEDLIAILFAIAPQEDFEPQHES